MRHFTAPSFWKQYARLPKVVRQLADKNYDLLKEDPGHPSLHFKQIGRFWSVRVGLENRALAVEGPEGPVWFWIGSHDEYEKLIKIG